MSEEAKPNPMLGADRFKLIELVNAHYSAVVEPGVTQEQILHPDFWGHIAKQLRPYDEIRVLCDDGSYLGRLVVLASERTFARVHLLSWHNLTTSDVAKSQADPTALALYSIEFKGPHLKHCVIRKSDSVAIREQIATKKEATAWLDDYVRVTA